MFAYVPDDNKKINERLKVSKEHNIDDFNSLEEILNKSQNAI